MSKEQQKRQKQREAQRAQQEQARDMEDDGGVVVPDGKSPVGAKGNDARKALFNKHKKQRQERTADEAETVPGVAELERMRSGEARGEGRKQPEPEASVEPDDQVEHEVIAEPKEEPKPDPDALVRVVINGQERMVPQRDIDRNGGIEMYQRSAAANQAFQEAARMRQEVEQERERLNRIAQQLEQEKQQKAAAPQQDDSEDAEFDGMTDEELVGILYSGDRKKGAKVMGYLRRRDRTIERPEPPQPQPRQEQPRQQQIRGVDNLTQAERSAVDFAMREYADVLKDQATWGRVRAAFKMGLADPANAHREAADIARDAAEYIRNQVRHDPMRRDLKDRQEMKRTLSQRGHASAPPRQPVEPDEKPRTKTSIIDEMRKRRGQPVMGER